MEAGDPRKEYWTMSDIIAWTGLAERSVWQYRVNSLRDDRKPGATVLPDPDDQFGRTPVWHPATILHWIDTEHAPASRRPWFHCPDCGHYWPPDRKHSHVRARSSEAAAALTG